MKTNLVQYLFFLTAAVLAAFGANSMFRANPNPGMKLMYMIYALLMLGDALAMLACGLFIRSKKARVFWFAILVLSLNILLTIFDQFGLVDLLFVLLNLLTLGLLITIRRELLPQ